jgi:voltage-gated sodium channel
LIVLNAAVMGLETSAWVSRTWQPSLLALEYSVQAVFVAEMLLRIAAHGSRPLAFFRDGWNLFDFGVVAVSLLPVAGPFATVVRLARVLRVARVVSGLPELRLIIGTMLRSIPSLGHVILLLGLLMYIYGVLGYYLFGQIDPEHWGSLGRAVSTLFIIITLEGWVEIQKAGGPTTVAIWMFYASFIVVAVFVVINLFIAVVLNNLEKTRSDDSLVAAGDPLARIHEIRRQLDIMEEVLKREDSTRTARCCAPRSAAERGPYTEPGAGKVTLPKRGARSLASSVSRVSSSFAVCSRRARLRFSRSFARS